MTPLQSKCLFVLEKGVFSAADFEASPTRIHKGRGDLLSGGGLKRFRRDSAAVNRPC
jgi:hypothetical protein